MVESVVAHLIASRRPSSVRSIGAGLHDRGVQIEIMRHHGRADDADRDVEHLGIGDDLGRRHKAAQHRRDRRRRGSDLDRKADRDHDQQRDDEGFEEAKALVHQQQQQEGVERGDQRAADQGNAEQQFQRDRGADHLGQIAGDDRRLAGEPQQEIDRPRIGGAAGLRQIAIGGDAEPRRQRLQQDRHQVRQQDHRQQRVAKLRTAREVGRPVAGVHVADRDQVAGSEKRQQPARPVAAGWGPQWSRSPRTGCAGCRPRRPRASRRRWRWHSRQGLGGQFGRTGIHSNKMTDIRFLLQLICNCI